MKAEIEKTGGESFVLKLTPENPADKTTIKGFGEATTRTHILNCRGFVYLSPDVEFLIQPYRGTD